MKNAKGCFGSDVVARSIGYVVTRLSWILAYGDGAWRHEWGMKLCYKLKMQRLIDGMFASSSGLCSWTGAQPGILFGSGQPLTSSDFKL